LIWVISAEIKLHPRRAGVQQIVAELGSQAI
jgi:hypothetical protein